MAGTEGRYFAAGAAFETESERLRLVEAYGDPITARQLEAVGVLPGWRCLEVGGGRGSVTRMLAERVGTSGSVVATDIDPRFLKDLKAFNIEVRQHNILTDPLDGPFDFVHSRYLLEHVSEPAKAIRNMGSVLRPGGVLLAEASDALGFAPADDVTPDARALERVIKVVTEVLAAAGVLDPFFGRKLPRLLSDAGLTRICAEAHFAICPGGSERAHLLRATIERVGELVIRSGQLTQREFDLGLAVLEDPHANIMCMATVSAVGRAA